MFKGQLFASIEDSCKMPKYYQIDFFQFFLIARKQLLRQNHSVIRFISVNKNFGLVSVFENISFDIIPGECVAITGESGAGKTTLINILIGAEEVSSGSIEIDEYKIEKLSRDDIQLFRRNIGVIFQDFKLLPSKTIFENVAFALEATDETDEEIEIKTRDAIKKVGLNGKEYRFPNELSGGEKQRAAIARALVHSPRMVIADEPTGNLDQKNSEEVIDLLRKINKEGITVIVATHNNEVLELLKPRIIRIENGKIKTGVFEEDERPKLTKKIDLTIKPKSHKKI